jgi:diguanylate cyclase (GGDEF)-like protein/hemerythrin-like metal-binding protein
MVAPSQPPPLPLAIQSFLAGLLVALAVLAILAYRPLRDRVLSLAGLFGLAASAAWIAFSGVAAAFLPGTPAPTLHGAALLLAGLCLVIWDRVVSGLLAASPGPSRQTQLRRVAALAALAAALTGVLPWRFSHALSEILLGLLAPLLALLTLAAGLRAGREGLRTARALVAAALALLICCASLWSIAAGWVGAALSLAILEGALVVLALALGGAMLSHMTELREASEAAQAAQVAASARLAQDLEALVAERNQQLSSRLRDLGEAQRAAEAANLGLQRAMEQLEEVASTDRLTGAWNRRRFEEAALPEIALAHRRREPLSLLMFDLDHFKRVNDTYGHGTGDAVLAATAETVRHQLRASDSLVRWGGEEFLVMAPATRLDGALGLAEKLRKAVAAIPFPGVGQVTMSLGVAEYLRGESLAAWIERADQALYQAKAGGRNRVAASESLAGPEEDLPSERSLLEVIWEESYESGHTLIDAQHQRLFRLASALMAVLTEHRPVAEVALRLETLLAHTAQHFHDEEALLREAHYRDVADHAATHALLLGRARKLQEEVQAGQLDFGRLVTFLALDLVRGHLLTEDRNYFAYLIPAAGPENPPGGA